MSNLRNKLIRLAHTKPELREHLLPLLKKGSVNKQAGFSAVAYSDAFTGMIRNVTKCLEELENLKNADDTTAKEKALINRMIDKFKKVQTLHGVIFDLGWKLRI